MSHPTQQTIIAGFAAKQAAEKYAMAQKIGTVKGFYQYYFDMLPKLQGREKTFDTVNELYYKIFGEYKYSDYNSFRRSLCYHLKKR